MFASFNNERDNWGFARGGFPGALPSKTDAHMTKSGPAKEVDSRTTQNVMGKHFAQPDGARMPNLVPGSNGAARHAFHFNGGYNVTANSVTQSNRVNDYFPMVNAMQTPRADDLVLDQGANSSSGTVRARFNAMADDTENYALSTGGESSLKEQRVLQDSEGNKAAGTIDGPAAQDTDGFISYLPMLDCPFTVQVSRDLSAGGHAHLPRPVLAYVIRPQTVWNAMSSFRSTIVDNVEYFIQQKAYFRITQNHLDFLRIGHILEIKSLDPRHVYIRVYWMYKPQDPPLTKEKYHGQSELIATNHMSVVDASRIVQHANVAHWAEASEPVPSGSLFWRQQYNVLTKELSQLQPTCVCRTPVNPDEQPFICRRCQLRMHLDCITRLTAERLTGNMDRSDQASASPNSPSGETNLSVTILPAATGSYEAGSTYKLAIIDFWPLVPRKWLEDACCLRCGEVLVAL